MYACVLATTCQANAKPAHVIWGKRTVTAVSIPGVLASDRDSWGTFDSALERGNPNSEPSWLREKRPSTWPNADNASETSLASILMP